LDFKAINERVLEQTKDHLKPELLNRLTGTLVFKPLSRDIMAELLQIRLKEFAQSWSTKSQVRFPQFTKKKIISIVDKIYDPQYGARPIERFLMDEVEPGLIEQLLAQGE
jgi:ATP-dependent Clp protease ATP-binding subunit ClpA